MRRLGVLLLVVALLGLPALPGYAWKPAPSTPSAEKANDDSIHTIRLEGETDLDMLKSVRGALEYVAGQPKIKTLRVIITSPGGPAITSLEIARILRDASDRGLIVETHGEGLVASGGTFVLSAGTPGKRYISKWAVFLVHAPQVGGSWIEPPTCGSFKDTPQTERDKIVNTILVLMRDHYVRYTGKPAATVEEWLSCGWEQIGTGQLAVDMGIADKVE